MMTMDQILEEVEELKANARQLDDAAEKRDREQRDAHVVQVIARAVEDSWPDGKHRAQLKTIMEERMSNMRRMTGFQTLDALKAGDRKLFDRFVDGCIKAVRRDGLIAAGIIGKAELLKLKDAELARRHHAETSDLHASFDDMSEERYP